VQEVLESEVSDEGLHALAVNNRDAVRLVTGALDKQRALVADAIKQADASFDKVETLPLPPPSLQYDLEQNLECALVADSIKQASFDKVGTLLLLPLPLKYHLEQIGGHPGGRRHHVGQGLL